MEDGSAINIILLAVIEATATACHPIKSLDGFVHELVAGVSD